MCLPFRNSFKFLFQYYNNNAESLLYSILFDFKKLLPLIKIHHPVLTLLIKLKANNPY